MGRGKVELKRIENRVSRQVTFSKRRNGLLKMAHELAVLCDVDVDVIVFSERGQLFEYPNPPASFTDLIRRYEAVTSTQLPQETHCTDHQQQMLAEIGRLRREYEQLEANLRAYTGEDLSSVASSDELDKLEQQLESALSKVRARKDELLINLTDELQLRIIESGRNDEANLRTDSGEELSSVASVDELDRLEQKLESALSKVRARKDELLINLADELQLKISRSGHHKPSPSFAYVLKVLAVVAMAALAAPPLAAATEHGYANVSVKVAAAAPYSYVLPMPNASTPTAAPPTDHNKLGTDGGKDKPNDKLLSTVLLGCSGALVAILLAFVAWEYLTGRQDRQLNVVENARQHSLSNIRVVNRNDEVANVHEDCDICLEPYRSGDAVGLLPCDHFFHADCIKTWIADGITPTCPSCRAVV